MLTYDDGFSGGGLATCGAVAAGLTPIGAVEYDPAIAECYRKNLGDHITVAPIQDIDWTERAVPFWWHMSPVCTRASQANSDGEESELDIAAAQAVVRSIEVHPPMFSLENVWQYRNFDSFKMIYRALRSNGYNVDYWHLNSADYGVPQTRKRLILVASRIKPVKRPTPTHAERTKDTGQSSMFDSLPSWVGWYVAIEDLIPTLPESQFAPWSIPLVVKFTNGVKAFLTGKHRNEWGDFVSFFDEPAMTIGVTSVGRHRIWTPCNKVLTPDIHSFARFQTLPDWYQLPTSNVLAGKIIGNGVPRLLMQRVIGANLN